MEDQSNKLHNFIAGSIVLRNICNILLLVFIIIGIRALCGNFDLNQMHILDIIIHYVYFISVLGFLCIDIRVIWLHFEINGCKGKTQSTGNDSHIICKQISINSIALVICIIVGVVIMSCERTDKVVDWVVLQYGLLAWIAVIYVGENVGGYIGFHHKKKMAGDKDIRHDSYYIPKLLEKIEDDKLKNYIAHELYTYAVRARFYKYGYYICSVTALVAPTIVVVLNTGVIETTLTKFGVSVFSGISAIASGMLGIVKFKESWTRYRYNCEMLKTEVAAYINGQGVYVSADKREQTFYERVNAIINEEILDWRKLRQENDS